MAGQPVLSVADLDKQKLQSVTLRDTEAANVAGDAAETAGIVPGLSGTGGGIAVAEVGEALQTAPVTAHDLVTQDLSQLGQRGFRSLLSRTVDAVESMPATPEIRSWNDLQVATKIISQTAGLDKPAVAVAVSLNNGSNASITAWESIDSV
jgi:hypothetical protein